MFNRPRIYKLKPRTSDLRTMVCTLLTFVFLFVAWFTHPVVSKTVVISIENVVFPTITLCPKNPNPDRWGPVIKIFDHLELKCNDQK